MRTLTLAVGRNSPAQIVRLSRFLRRRILRRKECSALVATLNAAYEALLRAIAGRDDAADARACATAELEYLDEVLDAAMANFVRYLLAHLGGDRDHATYKRMFTVNPSAAMRDVASAEQSTFVAAVLKVYNDDKSLIALSEHAAALQSALDALNAVRDERAALERDESVAEGELAACAGAMVTAYNNAFHELSMIYPGQKGLVRSFYHASRYEKKAAPSADGD